MTREFAVSILVHENPEIVADQSRCYRRFFPEAILVYHVSESAKSYLSEFEKALESHPWAYINPSRMETRWGDMLAPHVLNLEYIFEMFPRVEKVAFGSSTDMLFKPGVAEHMQQSVAGFDYLAVSEDTAKCDIRRKASSDPAFMKLYRFLGDSGIVWSQLEGSYYPAKFLEEFVRLFHRFDLEMTCQGKYFREEIILPTCFYALKNDQDGLSHPFILRGLFSCYWADSVIARYTKNKWVRKIGRYPFKLLHNEFWSLRNFEKIASGNADSWERYAVVNEVKRFSINDVYGVKRIRSKYDEPIRNKLRK